jgi:hypothetical protein
MAEERGIGKCRENHASSYGYPSRPEEPFPFCSQCGNPMVWRCAECGVPLPEDSTELLTARFCRHCGTAYFPDNHGPVGRDDAPSAGT